MKSCSKCGVIQCISKFNKDASKKDMLRPSCKLCDNKNYAMNSIEKKLYQKKWSSDNIKKVEDWKKSNPEYLKNYKSKRRNEDPMFKLLDNTQSLLYDALKHKRYDKTSKAYNVLGCLYDDFKIHIESMFRVGMTWDNYGREEHNWQYDHIIPLSSATNENHLIELFHYTNVQPLWSIDNKMKRDNLNWSK